VAGGGDRAVWPGAGVAAAALASGAGVAGGIGGKAGTCWERSEAVTDAAACAFAMAAFTAAADAAVDTLCVASAYSPSSAPPFRPRVVLRPLSDRGAARFLLPDGVAVRSTAALPLLFWPGMLIIVRREKETIANGTR
jgi:hypothetical protein